MVLGQKLVGRENVIAAQNRFGRAARSARLDAGFSGLVLPFRARGALGAELERAVVLASPTRGEQARLARHEAALAELGFQLSRMQPAELLSPERREQAGHRLRRCGLVYVASPSLGVLAALRACAVSPPCLIAALPNRLPASAADRALARELSAPRRVVLARSAAEAEAWRAVAPGMDVRVLPETVAHQPCRAPGRRAARRGLLFMGGEEPGANAGAARFLLDAVMPLVRASLADLPCLVSASLPPQARRGLAAAGATLLGEGEGLRVARLLVVPSPGPAIPAMLAALATRLPVAATVSAAKGLSLSPAFAGTLGADSAGLAAAIIRLHEDDALAVASVRAGGALLRRDHLPSALVDAFAAITAPAQEASAASAST